MAVKGAAFTVLWSCIGRIVARRCSGCIGSCIDRIVELHWQYCGEALHVWSLLKVNTCFIGGQVCHKQPSQVRGNTLFRTQVCVRREQELVD